MHIAGREVAPETGTPHLQGYVRFPNTQRFSWWKNQFPTAHVELKKGLEEQAWNYCDKAGDLVIKKGVPLTIEEEKLDRQGAAVAVMTLIDDGARLHDIRTRFPAFYFFNRSRVRDYKKDRDWWEHNDRSDLPDV